MPISRADQVLLAAGAALLLLLGLIGWVLVTSSAEPQPPTEVAVLGVESAHVSTPPRTGQDTDQPIIVDVEGAVVSPGIYELPSGSRVGEAVAAAGGYDVNVDLDAAAAQLNLAAPLSDGEKVLVPRVQPPGADGTTVAEGSDVEGSSDELVDVSTATAAELEALPGIGPVTAEKIIVAREEAPFTSLEELVERDAINNGQLEKIRDLAVAR